MSDITALNIFLVQQWHWATLHASLAIDYLAPESIALLKQVLLGEINHLVFTGVEPLNALATQDQLIEGVITGGNLTLVQTSIGTAWQLNTQDKILLLEETNERGYRVDRMLEHLYQTKLFAQAKAVILGDFIKGEEPDGSSL